MVITGQPGILRKTLPDFCFGSYVQIHESDDNTKWSDMLLSSSDQMDMHKHTLFYSLNTGNMLSHA